MISEGNSIYELNKLECRLVIGGQAQSNNKHNNDFIVVISLLANFGFYATVFAATVIGLAAHYSHIESNRNSNLV
jgi:hypothetical protein